MNRIRLLSHNFFSLIVIALLYALSAITHAENRDCWAEFFEESQYGGKHFRIDDAVRLENLNKVEGEDWNKRIHSLKVGPKAKLTVYQNPRFELKSNVATTSPQFIRSMGLTEQDMKEDSELIFSGESNIHDLGDFNFHKKISSLTLECLE